MVNLIRRLAIRISMRARESRSDTFLHLFQPQPGWRVLDVGSGSGFFPREYPYKEDLILMDIRSEATAYHRSQYPMAIAVLADAQHLPFANQTMDILFSNSVIEHVPDQQAFANEVRRVAKGYFIETPNKWFPIDSHTLMPIPYFHLLPDPIQRFIYRRLEIGWQAGQEYETVFLLSKRECVNLFPDAQIITEHFLGINKVLICYRVSDSHDTGASPQ